MIEKFLKKIIQSPSSSQKFPASGKAKVAANFHIRVQFAALISNPNASSSVTKLQAQLSF